MNTAAKAYVAIVIASGAMLLAAYFPRELPPLGLVAFLLAASCVTSTWKINLPIPLVSGSTLSVSYAANLMALLLAGPRIAVVVAAAGALTQCTVAVRQRYPAYRTAFSRPRAALGLQEETIGGTAIWLLPNPSGLNANYQPADLARLFRALKDCLSSIKRAS